MTYRIAGAMPVQGERATRVREEGCTEDLAEVSIVAQVADCMEDLAAGCTRGQGEGCTPVQEAAPIKDRTVGCIKAQAAAYTKALRRMEDIRGRGGLASRECLGRNGRGKIAQRNE